MKFSTNQLVRNNRIFAFKSDGLVVDYEILNDEQYLLELQAKLLEEINEVINAKSKKSLTSEIADVYEVLEHIISAKNLSKEKILQKQESKKSKLGGFDKRIKILSVEVDENNPCGKDGFNYLEYYSSQQYKYPEIK